MPGDFGGMNYLRRTDSKDSNCTSLSSVSHMHGRDDLRASMSVPAVAFGVCLINFYILSYRSKFNTCEFEDFNLISQFLFSE